MSRPPLANLFAFSAEDPSILGSVEADLAGSGEFAEVWRPAQGWLAASRLLPGSERDGDVVRDSGLAFAEGRDAVSVESRPDARQVFREVAEKTDRSPEHLASLPGDFGFARFRAGGSATVVRSCGGLVPFYLRCTGQCAAIATRLGDLVRYFPAESDLDPLVNAIWTTGHGFFPDGRTFLAGVSILARGHFARLERGRPAVFGRYWDPRPNSLRFPSDAVAREHAERLRALLVDRLTRDLDPEGGNLLTLSGGVDSSSLAALASGTVGRRVWTLSVLPAPQGLFDHEMSFIQPLVERFGFEQRWTIRLNADTPVQLLHTAPPAVFHVIHPALCALPRIVREAPVRVLFGGEFADEVCGSGFTIPDWAACTPAWRLAPFVRSSSGRRYLLRWAKARCLSVARRPALPHPSELPHYVRAEIREEYEDCFTRIRRRIARDHAPWSGLAARCEADVFLAMNWEAACELGIRRSFPFFNRNVLELAFECHPSELIGPGYKKLLRAALRDDVPERNLNRPDKGAWGSSLRAGHASWDTPLPDSLQAVVRPDWYPRPPNVLERSEAFGLTELVMFSRSLQARRWHGGQRDVERLPTASMALS
jgi:asparagine synthetase B (glutamine-hydrolysing)